MEFYSAYIHRETNGTLTAKAKVTVDGLGAVEFDHALSADLIRRINDEVKIALQVRLGQRPKTTPSPVPGSEG